MWRNDERRTPVPVIVFLVSTWHGRDLQAFTGDAVEAAKVAILCLCVHHVGIGGIDLCFEPITKLCHPPVAVSDAVCLGVAAWTTQREIILGACADIVERRVIIRRGTVELRGWQVAYMTP